MIYVGGIAVMFFFLILVVDVNIENVEGSKIVELKLLPCFCHSSNNFYYSSDINY